MIPIKIRKADLGDIKAIANIEDLSFEYPYPKEYLIYLLRRCEFFYVAELSCHRSIIGYVCGDLEYRRGRVSGHIYSIAVHPMFRKKGVGTALMEVIIRSFMNARAHEVYLECRKSNLIAQRFYKKLGFSPVGVIKSYYTNGEDAIIFKKDLERE